MFEDGVVVEEIDVGEGIRLQRIYIFTQNILSIFVNFPGKNNLFHFSPFLNEMDNDDDVIIGDLGGDRDPLGGLMMKDSPRTKSKVLLKSPILARLYILFYKISKQHFLI